MGRWWGMIGLIVVGEMSLLERGFDWIVRRLS